LADIDPFLSKVGVGLSKISSRFWKVVGLMGEKAKAPVVYDKRR
jgi:hypothetical protein